MISQAVILAGGKGTRLSSRLNGKPKPLIDVLGVALLERQIVALRDAGITEVLLLVNHEAAQIEEFCRQRQNWGIRVRLVDDGQPRGTAGAVLSIIDDLQPEFLVIYGDTLFDIDLGRFAAFHAEDRAVAGTLFLHPNDHPADSDIVVLDADAMIRRFSGYPHAEGEWLPNMVNAAMYILRADGLRSIAEAASQAHDGGILDFGKHVFPLMLEHGLRLRGYVSPEYIKDIGTPSRLDRACRDLANGVIDRASLRQALPAVFLDRDGTLNKPNGHVSRPEDLTLIDRAADALKLLRAHEYRLLLITNQPVVARGECSMDGLSLVHAKLETELGRGGAFLDRLYVCPHHPDRGFAGEVPALKIDCDCRKPRPGLVLRAAREMNIDLPASWFIGDSRADIEAARAAGVTSVLVRTGEVVHSHATASRPDFEFDDIFAAARFIAVDYESMRGAASVRRLLDDMQPGQDWFITGQARSGKSTLAQVIARELRLQARACRVISLDDWILPQGARMQGFAGRHDLEALRSAYRHSRRREREPVVLDMPRYDRGTRTSQPAAAGIELDAQTLLLWEGVAASLLIDELAQSRHAVFVDIDESRRKARMLDDLRCRGSSSDAAWAIYEERLEDEVPLVAAARARCAHVLPSFDSAIENDASTTPT